jgi:hypothetical protein
LLYVLREQDEPKPEARLDVQLARGGACLVWKGEL